MKILTKHKPHFFIVNELQLHKLDTVTKYQFPDYKIEHDGLDKMDGWARTAIFVKNTVKYKRRKDLESKGLSTVWLQVGLPGTKHFLVQGLYRQFQRPGRIGSKSHQSQKARWQQLIDNWERANTEGREILTLGDTNIDSMTWDTPTAQLPQYDRQKAPLYHILRDQILLKGTTKINTEYTRQEGQLDGRKSCLDHVYSNQPQQICSYQTIHSTFSDHAMVMAIKSAKKIQNEKKYIKIRSLKNYKTQTFIENIRNHHLYVELFYEMEPEIIATGVTRIMQESLEEIAPVKRIQITSRNTQTLSMEAREALVARDVANKKARENPNIENIREHKHLRNTANRIITQERYKRKKKIFEGENTAKSKWKQAKIETGQSKHTSPSSLKEGNRTLTKPREIAAGLNRQYISTIREMIRKIPSTNTNPLTTFQKYIGPINTKLNIEQINMHQLTSILRTMHSTTSSAADFLSVRLIKDAGVVLNPLILHLTNRIIVTEKYPEQFKLTKIIPIRKTGKPSDESSGWRPINIIPSLSKVTEKVILKQITDYMNRNNLIGHSHHGSIKGKGTQTLVQELYDSLLESLETGETTALIQTDQSKAYDVCDHEILLAKMKWLGFNRKTLSILRSYLENRRQYVVVDSFHSDPLSVGPRSVTQGSSLSCLLYVIYILDVTGIYHDKSHNPEESLACTNSQDNGAMEEGQICSSTSAKTFVDDNLIHVKAKHGRTITEAIHDAIGRLEDYTRANLLSLNPEKSKVMIVTKQTNIKKDFEISIGGKSLKHQSSLCVLGNVIADDLSWDEHIRQKIIPSLANRVRTLRQVNGYMDRKFRQEYSNAIFRGKLCFAADAWGGASKTMIAKVQDLQDRAASVTLGKKAGKKSKAQKLQSLGWPTVKQEIELATNRLTHKILHDKVPEELALKMPQNVRNWKIKKMIKLDTKPRWLTQNKRTNSTYRSRAYIFNTLPHRLTTINESKRFNKWVKIHTMTPNKLPNPIPQPDPKRNKPNLKQTNRQGEPMKTTADGSEPAKREQTGAKPNTRLSTLHTDPAKTRGHDGSEPAKPAEPAKTNENGDADPLKTNTPINNGDNEPIKPNDPAKTHENDDDDPINTTTPSKDVDEPVKDASQAQTTIQAKKESTTTSLIPGL